MTIYTAYFRTDGDYADREFEADTPEHALALARAFYDECPEGLMFQDYDGGQPVNEIEIVDPDSDALAVWRDDDLHRRLAAGDLLEALETQTDAAQAVIDAWESGDLADAVRRLDGSIEDARAAIAKAKGGAP
jgi:hypothetical protein